MARAEIRIHGEEAAILRKALAPEAGREIPGTRVTVAGRGATVTLTIEAEDAGALRAAVNSYLRWADVAAGVVKETRA
jgi:KEOPS complex subunit Pcc1